MAGNDELPSSDAARVIEWGETYDHEDHGEVEVTGIWQGLHEVDEARNTNEKDVIIIRYSSEQENGSGVDELTDPLAEFLEAID